MLAYFRFTSLVDPCCAQLQAHLEQLQDAAGVTPVDQALVLVKQLAARPAHVFDP